MDADFTQFGDGLLRGLGLQFAGGLNERHERAMQEDNVLTARVVLELAECFEEGQAFDVAGGATDFGDENVDAIAPFEDAVFDFVRDVRDHLDGLTEVVTAAFFLDDSFVDLTGAQAVEAGEDAGGKAFVVAEVEVGFSAIVEHVDFAVLVGAHGPWIDVEVGVEFLDTDLQAPAFKEGTERGGGEAFAEGGDNPSGDENILHEKIGRAGGKFGKKDKTGWSA